jgi:hypothetical protein
MLPKLLQYDHGVNIYDVCVVGNEVGLATDFRVEVKWNRVQENQKDEDWAIKTTSWRKAQIDIQRASEL